ncbi:hypothetical protein [Clostridium aceticum]|uniref:hypothetical protein n=1 Tax=Clostridium aceticum TaxID=84022 RepID=UPI000B103283|nr:hypothetical protein [Clostridium aceticum]
MADFEHHTQGVLKGGGVISNSYKNTSLKEKQKKLTSANKFDIVVKVAATEGAMG